MNPLRFPPDAPEPELRRAIVLAGRIAYERGLLVSNDGNLSVRMADGTLLITPSGLCKGRLDPEDLLIVDLDGKVLRADPARGLKPTSETPMHLEVYRQRPDVRAAIHAHPVYATALSVADLPVPHDVLPELLETLGPVPTTDFGMPSSTEMADVIRPFLKDHQAVLIRQHGLIAYGRDLDEALIHLERVEAVSQTVVMAHLLGTVNRIPPEYMPRLWEFQKKK